MIRNQIGRVQGGYGKTKVEILTGRDEDSL